MWCFSACMFLNSSSFITWPWNGMDPSCHCRGDHSNCVVYNIHNCTHLKSTLNRYFYPCLKWHPTHVTWVTFDTLNMHFALATLFSDFSSFWYPKRDTPVSCQTMKKVPFPHVFALTHGVQVTMGWPPGIFLITDSSELNNCWLIFLVSSISTLEVTPLLCYDQGLKYIEATKAMVPGAI